MTFEIPTVEFLQERTNKAKIREIENLNRQYEKFYEDIPRFIDFISQQLIKSAENGLTTFRLNFDDNTWTQKDLRVGFHFKGYCDIESQKTIENLFNIFFKRTGYQGYIHFFHNSTYRLGELELSWEL